MSTPATIFFPACMARDWTSLLGERADIWHGFQSVRGWLPNLETCLISTGGLVTKCHLGTMCSFAPLSSGIRLFVGGFGSPHLGCLRLYKYPSLPPVDGCQPLPLIALTTPSKRTRKKREHVSWQMASENRWQGGDRSGSWEESLAFPVQVRASHSEKIRKSMSEKIGWGGKRAVCCSWEKSLKSLSFPLHLQSNEIKLNCRKKQSPYSLRRWASTDSSFVPPLTLFHNAHSFQLFLAQTVIFL